MNKKIIAVVLLAGAILLFGSLFNISSLSISQVGGWDVVANVGGESSYKVQEDNGVYTVSIDAFDCNTHNCKVTVKKTYNLEGINSIDIPYEKVHLEGENSMVHKVYLNDRRLYYDRGGGRRGGSLEDVDVSDVDKGTIKYVNRVYRDYSIFYNPHNWKSVLKFDANKLDAIEGKKNCRKDSECNWCGRECYAEWNMPDTCPYLAPPQGYECACNKNTGECEKKVVDADGDGVPDYKDGCPDAGPEGKKIFSKSKIGPDGCPFLDGDADGVYDRNDACPEEAGSKVTGCPNLLERIVHFFGFERWMM